MLVLGTNIAVLLDCSSRLDSVAFLTYLLAWAVWLEIPGRGVVVCHVNAYTSLNGVTGVTDRRYYPAALSVVSTLL